MVLISEVRIVVLLSSFQWFFNTRRKRLGSYIRTMGQWTYLQGSVGLYRGPLIQTDANGGQYKDRSIYCKFVLSTNACVESLTPLLGSLE